MSLTDWLLANRTREQLAKELAATAKENALLKNRVFELEHEVFWMKAVERNTPMRTRITLKLSLQVTYETNDVPGDVRDLEENLMAIAVRASREGWLTQDTDAKVVIAAPQVERLA